MGYSLKTYNLCFDGALLRRGFWLYVWRIQQGSIVVFYVGRTGDSSSPYAASPFSRIERHLDRRKGARANSLYKQLRKERMDPRQCSFRMVTIGPIFSEQKDMDTHRPKRDQMAALEYALAMHVEKRLQKRGHKLIGVHSTKKICDELLKRNVLQSLNKELTRCFEI